MSADNLALAIAHNSKVPPMLPSTATSSVAFRPHQSTVLAGTTKFPFDMHVLAVDADRDAAFALRYRAYLDAGFITENETGLFSDSADDLRSTIVVIAYDAGRCVGTLRVCFSHPWQPVSTLPCAAYYPALKALKRDASGALVEVGRMAIDPAIKNTSYRTTLYAALVRAGFIAAQSGGASHILVTGKASSVAFYKAMLGFKVIGEPAKYPPGDIPITLLAGTINDAEKKQRAQNAFFRITLDEISSMKAAIQPALARPSLPRDAGIVGMK